MNRNNQVKFPKSPRGMILHGRNQNWIKGNRLDQGQPSIPLHVRTRRYLMTHRYLFLIMLRSSQVSPPLPSAIQPTLDSLIVVVQWTGIRRDNSSRSSPRLYVRADSRKQHRSRWNGEAVYPTMVMNINNLSN